MPYKCSIIADPERNAWDFAKAIYDKLKRKDRKYELNEVKIKRFSDGEAKPKISKNIRRKNCFFIHDSSLPPGEWFLELALINETMRNSSAQEITDVLPYLRFARQDRKDESRVPVSAGVIAEVIGLNANRVLTMDVHNPAIQCGYAIPFDNLYSFPVAIDYLREKHPEYLSCVASDAGGLKRVEAFAKRAEIKDTIFLEKIRNTDGKIEKLVARGVVKGKTVLGVEDMITSGGTVINFANAVREAGARKVGVYATHGLFTQGIERIRDCMDLVVVGDTYPNPYLKGSEVEVISFVDLFSEAIYRINEGKSLSALFE